MKYSYDVPLICDYDTTNDWWFVDERELDLMGDDREFCEYDEFEDYHDNDEYDEYDFENHYVEAMVESVIKKGDLQELKQFLDWRVPSSYDGKRLLHLAIESGQYDIVCYLATKVKKEGWDDVLKTAVGARENGLNIVRFLVNIVGLNVTDEVMEEAKAKKQMQIVQFLEEII